MKNIPQKESRYYPTFREFLTDVSDRYADAPAITTYLRGSKRHDKSFRELKEDSFAFASALFASGLNGKHIALISENSYEWLVSYFGTAIAGGVSICIDTEHADQTILEMVQQADAEGIICSSALRNLCSTIEEEIPQIKRVIVIGGKEDDPESFTSFLLMSKDAEAQHRFSAYQIEDVYKRQVEVDGFTFAGQTAAPEPVPAKSAKVDLNLEVAKSGGCYQFRLEYADHLFAADTVSLYSRSLITIVREILRDDSCLLENLSAVSAPCLLYTSRCV